MAVLAGKRALVIGGTRGIGAGVSRRLAADGAAVAIIYRDRADGADALVRELAQGGADVKAFSADVADPAALADAMDEVLRRFGRLEILVNVAGLAITGDLDSYPPPMRSIGCSRSTSARRSLPPCGRRRSCAKAVASSRSAASSPTERRARA